MIKTCLPRSRLNGYSLDALHSGGDDSIANKSVDGATQNAGDSAVW